MNLIRFPLGHMSTLRSDIDSLLDDFLLSTPRMLSRSAVRQSDFPALNAWKDAECLYFEAELPGLKIEDLDISVQGNQLAIHGKRLAEAPSDIVYHRQERGTGEFSRIIDLPCEINPDAVEASLKLGVLRIKLPKAEAAKPKKIEVKTQ